MEKNGLEFLAGGGEMGALVRRHDWTSTPLGSPGDWPQSLRSAVSILLPSKAQIVLFWGPDLITIYNDAYRPTFGTKHPWALGRPARECWAEVWSVLEPLFTGVVRSGEAFRAQDHPFFLERHGYPEETYFDVSYDPVRDETGGVGGIFCIVSETTGRVLGERRLRTLRELGEKTAPAETPEAVYRAAAEALAGDPADVPWALLYHLEPDDRSGLVAVTGVDVSTEARALDVGTGHPELAPLAELVRTGTPREISPSTLGLAVPRTASPERALALPITSGTVLAGFLVAGVSRYLTLEGGYRDFFTLVADRISTLVAASRALEEERRRAEALAELDRAKTAFFSNVSHEFRTPLTLILGLLEDELAGAGALPAVRRERMEAVHRNALRLLKLVNTLLDFARVEAGRVEPLYLPTDLAALTADLASVFRSAVERAGLRLVVECEPPPEAVYVDREMWEKVVLNLLSNALKFTFEGEIAVRLRAAGEHVELVIRDTGVGISAEELPHLFERFHRVRGTRARTHEGTGIGLALVQELVRLHGGRTRVESRVGEGSTFSVAIPRGTAHLPAQRIGAERGVTSTALGAAPYVAEALRWLPDGVPGTADALAEPGRPPGGAGERPGAAPARIILADDNADMREYLRRLLAERWTVEAVGDGAAALALIRERPPDLVVTDVMMPGLDGFELLRALREVPHTREIPILMLTARAGEESRIDGLDAGADDYLVKPFSARELVARVAGILGLSRARQEATLRERGLRTEAEAARREAEAANRAKDEFLASVSHELRTPLSAILGWAQVLRMGRRDETTAARAVETIERNARAQVQLIEDLLDVSRIVTGKLRLDQGPVDLVAVIAAAIDAFRPAADAKGIRLDARLDPAAPGVSGDGDRLQQVVSNLLSNAVKFTPSGGRIEVRLDRDRDHCRIEVSDTGEGIPAAFLPHVFDRFRQLDSGATRSHGGLGLGLAIGRHLVELHGGTITAASPGPGKGARFTVKLPAGETISDAWGADWGSAQGLLVPALGGLTVLVVDDDPDARSLVMAMLRHCGAQAVPAASAAEALETLTRIRPDVVVSDIAMPGQDGYELIRRIRAHSPEQGSRAPAVALTAFARSEDRSRALQAGFQAHIAKPVQLPELARVVATLAGRPLER